MENIIRLNPRTDFNGAHPDLSFQFKRLLDRIARLEEQLRISDSSISVPSSDGIEIIQINDVVRCEADGNYCWIFTKDAQPLYISKPLKFVESQLPEGLFLKVHQSHLVKISSIRKIVKNGGKHLILKDGNIIPISRSKWGSIENYFYCRKP